MNRIRHLIEPNRLMLSWQRSIAGSERRTRRIVGEIVRSPDGAIFRYLPDRPDFAKAVAEGFRGFPAFRRSNQSEDFSSGVLDAFVRRLPPRKRDDFSDYLARFRLPFPFDGSDMALLAYTGAKLPGDGFELIPDFGNIAPPLEMVLEIAGHRHHSNGVAPLAVGDPVRFVPEPENEHDPHAVAIHHAGGRIGYVPGPFCPAFNQWLNAHRVEGVIDRLNGKPERPLVYLFVTVAVKTTPDAIHDS